MTKATKLVGVFFIGTPGDGNDLKCRKIFEAHGGQFENCGTFAATLERDVEYRLKLKQVAPCVEALKAAGFDCIVVGRKNIDDRFDTLLQKHFA